MTPMNMGILIGKNILVLLIIFLLPITTLAVKNTDSTAQNSEVQSTNLQKDSARKLVKQIDPNGKIQKILPNSNFYTIKLFWQTFLGWFKWGNKNAVYNLNLSQQRLVESFAFYENDKNNNLERSLKAYINLSTKIENKDLSANLDTLEKNNTILQTLEFLSYDDAKNYNIVKQAVAKGIDIYDRNAQRKNFSGQTNVREIEGTIVYKITFPEPTDEKKYNPQINLILNWTSEDKNILLLPGDNLEILDVNGDKLNNLNSVSIGTKLKIQLLNDAIYNYKEAQVIINPDGNIILKGKAQAIKINVE